MFLSGRFQKRIMIQKVGSCRYNSIAESVMNSTCVTKTWKLLMFFFKKNTFLENVFTI